MSQDPEKITFFAKTDARGQEVSFGIKAKDRTRHVYVIGKTGMGKSTLLENMAVQDIENGNGFAFIDPHGQTAETLLNYIPEERKDDVLYFAPFDTDYPVSFNVMEDVGPERRHLVVSGLMSVFKKIWVDAWSARMEYILSNTLLALLEYPDSTLLGVNRMLSDKVYRRKVIDNISDPAVKSFWVDEFLNYNERYMQEAGDAIKNKIGQFTSNPLIRNIIGQPKSSFDIREIMDQKKILIMNLSKGLVGESNANLLGSMLTTRIYLAAMSRADLTQDQMKLAPNFYFYVDEFQSFANATFADILSEARKYKLNLTIAHQYIEQMEEEVRNAVFGNVGTIISFRVGPFDAEVLESIFTPKFLAPDIVNLGFAQIYLTLMIDGIGSQPFSATTLPPIEEPEVSCRDMVVQQSRKSFAHPRSSVEAMINAWHDTKDEPPAKKNNQKKNGGRQNTSGNIAPKNSGYNAPQRQPQRDTREERPSNTKNVKQEGASHQDRNRSNNQRNEKTPEDLRTVLKKIASEDTKNTPTKVKENEKPNEKKVDQKDDGKSAPANSPLKSALAEALGGLQKEKEHAPNTQQKKEVRESEDVKKDKPKQNQHNEQKKVVPEQHHEVKNGSREEAKHSDSAARQDDPLSPKKLERMMRVTGNDKTPLK